MYMHTQHRYYLHHSTCAISTKRKCQTLNIRRCLFVFVCKKKNFIKKKQTKLTLLSYKTYHTQYIPAITNIFSIIAKIFSCFIHFPFHTPKKKKTSHISHKNFKIHFSVWSGCFTKTKKQKKKKTTCEIYKYFSFFFPTCGCKIR